MTRKLKIGRGCHVNRGAFFDNSVMIEIRDGAFLGCQVTIVTRTHDIGSPSKRAGPGQMKPVEIGEGCWIGARSVILPGARIGSGCVVAAGSVVTGDLEPNGLYAGVPAIRKRDLNT